MSLQAICTTTELSGVTGLTPRRLNQLQVDGIVFKDTGTRDRWLVSKSIRGLLAFYKAGRGGTGRESDQGGLDPSQEKAKLDVLKQMALADVIKTKRGDLVDSSAAEALFADLVRAVVRGLETLPDILERDAGLTGQQVEISQGVIDAIRDRLYADMKRAAE